MENIQKYGMDYVLTIIPVNIFVYVNPVTTDYGITHHEEEKKNNMETTKVEDLGNVWRNTEQYDNKNEVTK